MPSKPTTKDTATKHTATKPKPENPAYPSGVSPSRTNKNPDDYALRTILCGKSSFVSAYVVEGVPLNNSGGPVVSFDGKPKEQALSPASKWYGLQRCWIESFESNSKGVTTDRSGLQRPVQCVTKRGFNQRYTEEVVKAGITLANCGDNQLKVESRNSNAYCKASGTPIYSRLAVLYLEPCDRIISGFAVHAFRLHDESMPIEFAYAQAIVGRKLEQFSFDQENRYNAALTASKLNKARDWRVWNSLSPEQQTEKVNNLLNVFNNGASIGCIK